MEINELKNRTRKVTVRLTEAEYALLYDRFRLTTKRDLSAYLRGHLLEKTLTVRTRNASLDDLVEELVRLRKELNALGQNFNQAVRRLHAMDHILELRAWVRVNEKSKAALFEKVAAIQEKIDQIDARW